MTGKSILALIVIILMMASCTGPTPRTPQISTPKKPVFHHYILKIITNDGIPVENATIVYETIDAAKWKKETTFSDNNGIASIIIKAKANVVVQPNGDIWYYGDKYISSISYKITKENYFLSQGELKFKCGTVSSSENCTLEDKLVLIPFFTNDMPKVLQQKIHDFMNVIMIESILRDTVLIKQPIELDSFKNRKYLKISFINLNIYNSVRLNKYQIGQILFDDVIRKLLTHLNNAFANVSSLNGYELVITASSKNFINDSSKEESLDYKFFFPKDPVKKYKNLDITGQQLLNSSIILLDNERIELKLQ